MTEHRTKQEHAERLGELAAERHPDAERNEHRATLDWPFTAHQAREKLKRLYPVVEAPAGSAPWVRAPGGPHGQGGSPFLPV